MNEHVEYVLYGLWAMGAFLCAIALLAMASVGIAWIVHHPLAGVIAFSVVVVLVSAYFLGRWMSVSAKW